MKITKKFFLIISLISALIPITTLLSMSNDACALNQQSDNHAEALSPEQHHLIDTLNRALEEKNIVTVLNSTYRLNKSGISTLSLIDNSMLDKNAHEKIQQIIDTKQATTKNDNNYDCAFYYHLAKNLDTVIKQKDGCQTLAIFYLLHTKCSIIKFFERMDNDYNNNLLVNNYGLKAVAL